MYDMYIYHPRYAVSAPHTPSLAFSNVSSTPSFDMVHTHSLDRISALRFDTLNNGKGNALEVEAAVESDGVVWGGVVDLNVTVTLREVNLTEMFLLVNAVILSSGLGCASTMSMVESVSVHLYAHKLPEFPPPSTLPCPPSRSAGLFMETLLVLTPCS